MLRESMIKKGAIIKIIWNGEIADSEVVSVPEPIRFSNILKIIKLIVTGNFERKVKICLPDGNIIACKTFIPMYY